MNQAVRASAKDAAPDASTRWLIEGIRVAKTFKDFWGRPRVKAVRDVTIRVPKGSVFGLLGPNGAGKSTMMKMILGHLYPTAGTLTVFGKPPTDVEAKRRLGYLPERSYLYKTLTPMETLKFFGEVLELPAAEIRSRSEQLLDMVGLGHAGNRLVGEFSHGMTRRMGLAQALLNDPDLIMLDEPTAGLDPIGCREVKNLILTLAKRGKTVLLTSHLLADVQDVCDHILVMYGGTVVADGDIGELLAHKDQLQIQIPASQETSPEAITSLLSSKIAPETISFSNPRRSLESFFVELVEQASTKQETHGARAGAGVAKYLQGDQAEVIEPSAPKAPAASKPEQAPSPVPTPAAPKPVSQAPRAEVPTPAAEKPVAPAPASAPEEKPAPTIVAASAPAAEKPTPTAAPKPKSEADTPSSAPVAEKTPAPQAVKEEPVQKKLEPEKTKAKAATTSSPEGPREVPKAPQEASEPKAIDRFDPFARKAQQEEAVLEVAADDEDDDEELDLDLLDALTRNKEM